MKLLLKNLVENALRHTPETKRPVEVKGGVKNGSLYFEIKDQGEDIPSEHLNKLMEPFCRVEPSRDKTRGGYGLGLYLCKLIAEAHGGTLSIQSSPGWGTTVVVLLPCVS